MDFAGNRRRRAGGLVAGRTDGPSVAGEVIAGFSDDRFSGAPELTAGITDGLSNVG